MSADKNLEIIQTAYKEWGAGNFEAALARFAPNATYTVAEGALEVAGTVTGVEAIGALWAKFSEVYQDLEVQPEGMWAAEDRVFMVGNLAITGNNGSTANGRAVHIFTLEGGQVTAFEAISDTAVLNKAHD